MAEYIKREAFVAWLKRIPLKDLSEGRGLCRIIMEEDFKRAIRELPREVIADVAPGVHGKPAKKIRTVTLTTYHEEIGHFAADGANLYRKEMTHAEIPYEHCPVCGATLCSRWHNFCGKCGARMDGEA